MEGTQLRRTFFIPTAFGYWLNRNWMPAATMVAATTTAKKINNGDAKLNEEKSKTKEHDWDREKKEKMIKSFWCGHFLSSLISYFSIYSILHIFGGSHVSLFYFKVVASGSFLCRVCVCVLFKRFLSYFPIDNDTTQHMLRCTV